MSAGFTEGPWGYSVRPNGTMVILTREPSGGARKHIAEMSWADSEGGEPDARLIAAAPDLLAMLDLLIDEINEGGIPLTSTIEAAQDLIDKTRGEA